MIISTKIEGLPVLTVEEKTQVLDLDPIRKVEVVSIRRFVEKHVKHMVGDVLDFGAGKPGTCRNPQPFRALIEAHSASYTPIDVGDEFPTGFYDSVICTQVLNYCGPVWAAKHFSAWLKPGGHLLMTYPTCWAEVEPGDYWRFTQSGMEKILKDAQLEIVAHEQRAAITIGNFSLPLGHGVLARKLA